MKYALGVCVVALSVVWLSPGEGPEDLGDAGERPDHPGEATAWRLMTLRDESGAIPANALMNAKAQVDALRTEGIAGGLDSTKWTELGPGNIGGRTRAIALHPTTAGTLFVGSVAGGMWKSTNSGATWTKVNDLLTNLAITSIVFTPGNPSVMYASTGEGFGNGDGIRGAGIFKSSDAGVTWAQLPSTTGSAFYMTNRLTIAPSGAWILAACGGPGDAGGIYRSIDAGVSWTKVGGSANARSCDVKFHPTNSNIAVAQLTDYDSTLATWYNTAAYSTNGGATWTLANGPRTNQFYERSELAWHRGWTGAGNGCVYALKWAGSSTTVYRSTDGGANYVAAATGLTILGGQGWYDNCLWVDPSDADATTGDDVLVAGGIDLWRSTNGGASWTQISQWYSWPSSAHADHHRIVEDPGFNGTTNTTVWFGNDGGVWRTANVYTVALLSGWVSLNSNLPVTQFYGGSRHAGTGIVIGGTQDNGTLRYTPAGGPNGWTTMFGGDGGFCASNATNSSYHYGEYVNLQIHRSNNGGVSSSYIFTGIADAGTNALFIAPFVLDPNNQNTLLAGGASLWRSTNATVSPPTWASIKTAVSGQQISAIAVAQGNSNVIWVGYTGGDVWYTTNGTAAAPTWTQRDTTTPLLPDRYVTRITIDPANASRVFATFGGYATDNVWQTANAGTNWTAATGLPSAPVRDLEIHPLNSGWLYAGTEVGLLVSTNNGASWTSTATPATVSIDEMFWSSRWLYLVTHGRGMFAQSPFPPPATTTVGAACAFGGPYPPALTSTLPTLGTTCSWSLTGGPPSSPSALFVSTVPAAPIQPWPGCFVQLDLATLVQLASVPLSATGAATYSVVLPDTPAFAGTALMTQAACVYGAQLRLSNGVKVTLGY